MARIGGRNTWLAVPAGLLCAGSSRRSLARAADGPRRGRLGGRHPAHGDAPARCRQPGDAGRARGSGSAIDCRALYPDGLWSRAHLAGAARCSADRGPPATAVTSLDGGPRPERRASPAAGGSTTAAGSSRRLAAVAADAAEIADAALRGQGFACATGGRGAALPCACSGDVIEEHTVRGGLWLSSMETDVASRGLRRPRRGAGLGTSGAG